MKSAECLFLEKGVDATTIEEITQGAAVSKGAFYLHFSSKADVLEMMRICFVQELLDRLIEDVRAQDDNDWSGKLQTWAKACATGYLNATRLHNLVFAVAPPTTQDGLTSNILIDDLVDLLLAGNREKAWSLAAPEFTAVFLFNALHGVVNRKGIAENEIDRLRLLQDIADHFGRVVNDTNKKSR